MQDEPKKMQEDPGEKHQTTESSALRNAWEIEAKARREAELQVLDRLLILFGGLDAADAAGDDLDAVDLAPGGGQFLVEGIGELLRVAGQGAVADPLVRDSGEGGLQGCQELGPQLIVDPVACVIPVHIAADVLVEKDRVGQFVDILAEATDGDIQIQSDIPVHDPEGNRAGRAVLVADDILGVEIIDALVVRRHTAVGNTRCELLEALLDALSQASGKDAGLGGRIIRVGTGLRADIHDRALVDNDHTLAFIDHDRRPVGDDVLTPAPVQEAGFAGVMLALAHKDIRRHFRAVEIFLPLIPEHRTE